jgi:hypothetical protein
MRRTEEPDMGDLGAAACLTEVALRRVFGVIRVMFVKRVSPFAGAGIGLLVAVEESWQGRGPVVVGRLGSR